MMRRACGHQKHDGDCECHIDGIVLDDFTRESEVEQPLADVCAEARRLAEVIAKVIASRQCRAAMRRIKAPKSKAD